MSSSIVTFLIQADPPKRLDKALSRDVPEEAELSRSQLTQLLAKGAIKINGVVTTEAKAKVVEGQEVEITVPQATEIEAVAQNIPIQIVYEDDDVVVVNKPAGMVVHPAPGSPDGTLVNALLFHCADSLSGIGGEKRPGIVHRIDKDTSGLLVVAKNDRAHHGLAEQFERHSVERYYRAICFGVPDANDPRVRGVRGVNFEAGNIMKITTHLARHKTDRQRQAVFFEGGRHAVTRVRIVEKYGQPECVTLVECWLETGRTHQIRVHMAHTGHGLIGDPVYGGKRKLSPKSIRPAVIEAINAFPRQALHAAVLGFEHPSTGELMRFEADIPDDMADLIAQLQTCTNT
jgi:23S rRNA pseudouridine1911/1915/1917 synthase